MPLIAKGGKLTSNGSQVTFILNFAKQLYNLNLSNEIIRSYFTRSGF